MNKIASLHIENFTVFKKNTIEFSPGLNVLIGKNGTGKTHLLKILYSFLNAHTKGFITENGREPSHYGTNFTKNLSGYFKTSVADFNFIRKKSLTTTATLKINFIDTSTLLYSYNATEGLFFDSSPNVQLSESLYIPPQEMISAFEGFAALWEKREISFDKTYYDLAMALALPPLKDLKLFGELIKLLKDELNAEVIQENGRFYLEYEWGKIEAHLVAEGLRKLSQIIYLIKNDSISENTILLWDEPEVHFNPTLIEAIVVLLRSLVDKGLQIFITTHDYLLSQRLSLISEYENPEFPIKFFCLENEGDKGIKIEEGTTLAEIKDNPILNEFADYYDFERAAFSKATK